MRTRSAIGGFAAGAAFMYFADRTYGHRRRTIVRDKTMSTFRDLGSGLNKAGRDALNRSEGLAAFLLRGFRSHSTGEAALEARVRTKLGRSISHPHAITVWVNPRNQVVLSGAVLSAELKDVLDCVTSVRGVREVVNRLDVFRDAEGVPQLQGGSHRRARNILEREMWPPAARAGAGSLGGAAMISGLRQAGPAGWITALAGAALLTRAATNKSLARSFGIISDPRGVHFDKAIRIGAPLETVYRFWENFENFPRFMSHLKEVRNLGSGRSRWVAEGPAGVPVVWEAEITAQETNRRLAWRSVPGSAVQTTGEVRFQAETYEVTRVEIHMTYTPPAGVLGHAIAFLTGADPKREIHEDLIRLKSLLETGRTHAHGHRVTLQEALRH